MKDCKVLYWSALLAITLAILALAIDVSVARFLGGVWVPGDVRKLVHIAEAFAHGFGVMLILITAGVLDPQNRWKLARVASCSLGAGLLAQTAKLLVPRMRPSAFDTTCGVLQSFRIPETAAGSGWLRNLEYSFQSLPSGHTATAVGLALGLSWLYPRGKWLFTLFALLAALQRVESRAHFLSDTLVGAAIACLVAGICLDDRLLGRLFTRLERRSTPDRPV